MDGAQDAVPGRDRPRVADPRDADSERDELTREELLEALVKDAEHAYAAREAELEEMAGEGAMRQLERNVLLNVIDRKWREHLYEMDYLKEGIGLRAMAQRDPLVEYQREGYDMFMAMLDGMKEESVGFLFNVSVEAAPSPQVAQLETPEGLAEFAAAAVAQREQQRCAHRAREEANLLNRCAPRGLTTSARPDVFRPVGGRFGGGPAQRRRTQRTPAGAPGGASRRERRAAARQQGRGAKPPKSVKRR